MRPPGAYPDRAEDAVQDTPIEAWRDLRGLRDPERLDAWLYRLLDADIYRFATAASPTCCTLSVPTDHGAVVARLDRVSPAPCCTETEQVHARMGVDGSSFVGTHGERAPGGEAP
jgi:Sigma-70 region 2